VADGHVPLQTGPFELRNRHCPNPSWLVPLIFWRNAMRNARADCMAITSPLGDDGSFQRAASCLLCKGASARRWLRRVGSTHRIQQILTGVRPRGISLAVAVLRSTTACSVDMEHCSAHGVAASPATLKERGACRRCATETLKLRRPMHRALNALLAPFCS
jgi:hypothetical protein